jgi:exonuclease VII large subunit
MIRRPPISTPSSSSAASVVYKRQALDRAATAALERRRQTLASLLATLAAHDPQRTLERGYALLEDPAGEPITSAASARSEPALTVRMHDGRLRVRPDEPEPPAPRLPGL